MDMIQKIIFFTLVVLLWSCTGKNTKEYASVDEMVKDAKTHVEFISAENFKAELDKHAIMYLIDCRETQEFDSSCIKSAINIPRGTIESVISEKAPKHRQTVYIYCDNGDRSTLTATILPQLKYTDVKVIEGGFDAVKAKFPALVEIHPKRGDSSTKVTAKPSGGCGG
jgi:rhodanese-related sulfurtransferase